MAAIGYFVILLYGITGTFNDRFPFGTKNPIKRDNSSGERRGVNVYEPGPYKKGDE